MSYCCALNIESLSRFRGQEHAQSLSALRTSARACSLCQKFFKHIGNKFEGLQESVTGPLVCRLYFRAVHGVSTIGIGTTAHENCETSRRVKPKCIENCSAFTKQALPECRLYRQKNALFLTPICPYLLLFATSFCYCRLLSCDETSPAAATVGVGLQWQGSETVVNQQELPLRR